jgi:hypothetical protein
LNQQVVREKRTASTGAWRAGCRSR